MKSTNKLNAIQSAALAIAAVAVKASGAETITTPAAATKADKARVVFAESYAASPVPARKDIIGRAVAEAGLTTKGAATYLQNYKRKNGLSASKAAVATA